MLFKVFVCLLFVSLVSARSVTQDNNRYIIVLREGSTLGDIEKVKDEIVTQEQMNRDTLEIQHINNLLPMVFATVSEDTVMKIRNMSAVSYVERDQPVHMLPLAGTHNTSKWLENSPIETDRYGLDIMSKKKDQCRDNLFHPLNDGTGVDIYIMDTGIRYDHKDFLGLDGKTRAKYGEYDAIEDGRKGADCNGHGSHVAGTAAGLQSGVAKNGNLWSIRVLGCTGSGTISGIEKALNFVANKHEENKVKPDFVGSIVSMSLGSGKSTSFNSQVNKLVGKGVTVVTASGNDGMDACGSSPGSAGDNINVGAHSETQKATNGECFNPIAYFSNWGTCVDVIAAGVDILSVDYSSDVDFTKFSGTSMACPHVAGTVALHMKNDKSLTPAQIKAKIVDEEADDIDRSKEPKRVRDASKSQRLHVPYTL